MNLNDENIDLSTSPFLLYRTGNNAVMVEIYMQNETVWLTQQKISDLFGVTKSTVSEHFKNIFDNNELNFNSTVRKFRTVQKEGSREVTRNLEYYNLDAILSVGYRVNSIQATQFRIWASTILKEYLIKGFAMDDERLKNPNQPFGKDYFEEQLSRIRDIRSSERRFYQKITDIYAQCSIDYNKEDQTTKRFFATVQNKLHWAISGQTAAELIVSRVSIEKPNMGLTNWKNAPNGMIRKPDVSIAKNYLDAEELDNLNRIVTMYLDYAESQAKKNVALTMKDWVQKLDAFLQFNEESILKDNGKVSHEVAKSLAENVFETYNKIQINNYSSDFDKEILKLSKV
jgi:hypothetical protein